MKERFWRKVSVTTLTLLFVTGIVPFEPVIDLFDNITVTVSAENDTASIDNIVKEISSASDFGSYTAATQEGNSGWYSLESGSYKLVQDIDIDGYLRINYYKNVVLDLNGHTLRQSNEYEDSRVIDIFGGSLILRDSSGNNSGKITGGNISDYTNGAGIRITGTFVMDGGTITGNNSAIGCGGGVYLSSGSFTMNGGVITDNKASFSGNGVYVNAFDNTTFNISGNVVINDETYLEQGQKINVTGELDPYAGIHVAMQYPGVFTNGLSGKGRSENFISNDSNHPVAVNGNGEAVLLGNVNINSTPNGTVTADRDPAQYFEGDKVTLSVSPDNGYILDTIEIDAQGVVLNDDYTFIMPSGDVTVRAVFKEADIEEWDSDRTISETEVIYNGVYVEHDMTLTVESGTSLTVYNGINISEGCTLTINGAGILKVYGREGEQGESLPMRTGGTGGTGMASVYGKVVVNGANVRLIGGTGGAGGDGFDNILREKGYNGGRGGTGGVGINGDLIVNSGNVCLYGGDGGNGGAGGTGARRDGFAGRKGDSGIAIDGTFTCSEYIIAEASHDETEWISLSGNTSDFKYVRYYAPISDIVWTDSEKGTITADIDGIEVTEAAAGDTVTLTVTANEGYTVKSVYVNGEAHELVDGKYEFTMPKEDVTITAEFNTSEILELKGYSLSLEGDIGLNIFFHIDESVINDPSAGMIITLPNGKTIDIPVADFEKNDKGYRFRAAVSAKEMTAPIHCALYYNGAEDVYAKDVTVRDAARLYLTSYQEGTKEHELVKAMLHYGSTCQTAFGYKTEDLADDGIEYITPEPQDRKNFAQPSSNDKENISYYGSTVVLETMTRERHYFIINGDVNDYTFTISGKTVQPCRYSEGSKYFYIDSDPISANDLDDVFEVTVQKQGETIIEFAYSPLDYVDTALATYTSENVYYIQAKALYGYYIAAENYR